MSGDYIVKKGIADRPDIVKIDVEGKELSVLKGMRNTLLDEKCSTIYCEVHREKKGRKTENMSHERPQEVQELIESMGFSVRIIEDTGTELVMKGMAN
jgi:hypothetical protein